MPNPNDIRSQCEISSTILDKGGQHAGPRDVQITIRHIETGIIVILPEGFGGRSQHKRVQAGLDVIEYLLNV